MGFDLIFDDDLPEHLKCPICLAAFEKPLQTGCGHLFCESCLRDQRTAECSVCKVPLRDSDLFFDKHVFKEVLALKLKCQNSSACKWAGTLSVWVNEHSSSCKYAEVQCPHEACKMVFLRKHQVEHDHQECKARPVPCIYCGQRIPFYKMESHVETDCESYEVSCPYLCGVKMVRSKVSEHEKVCQLAPAHCKFEKHGCNFKGKRRNLAQHMLVSTLKHEGDIVDGFINVSRNSVRADAKQLTREVAQEVVQEVAREHHETFIATQESTMASKISDTEENLVRKMSGVENDIRKEIVKFHSMLQTLSDNFEGRLETCLQRVQEMDGRRAASALPTSASSQDLTSLTQRIDNVQKALESRLGRVELLARQNEATLSSLTAAVADLDIRVNMCENVSHDGTLVWKVTHWHRRREDAKRGKSVSVYSQPFYTSARGYKCCARLYPNGDGQGHGTHASLFFVIMQNEFDAIMSWPFSHKVTFMLINQNHPQGGGGRNITETFRPDTRSSSFQRPVSAMNVASGCPKFVQLRTLEDPDKGFVKDDCVFIQVIVDTSTIRNTFS